MTLRLPFAYMKKILCPHPDLHTNMLFLCVSEYFFQKPLDPMGLAPYGLGLMMAWPIWPLARMRLAPYMLGPGACGAGPKPMGPGPMAGPHHSRAVVHKCSAFNNRKTLVLVTLSHRCAYIHKFISYAYTCTHVYVKMRFLCILMCAYVYIQTYAYVCQRM